LCVVARCKMVALGQSHPSMLPAAERNVRTSPSLALPPGLSAPPGLECVQDDVDFSSARLRAIQDNVFLCQRSMQQAMAQQQALAQHLLLRRLQAHEALSMSTAGIWSKDAGVSAKRAPSSDTRSTRADSEDTLEASGSESPSSVGESPKQTTVMMRNIPNSYTRSMLLKLVDKRGFSGTYDLAYLPMDFATNASFGYGFLNFTSAAHALGFREYFHGFRKWDLSSGKVCQVSWGSTHQGLEANIARYRNCPVMHTSVSDEFKPALFAEGKRVAFPAPTKKLSPPTVTRRK